MFFFQICFFTAEVSHFLGQKIQKHFFFLKKYFPKLFLHKSICFFLMQNLVTFWDKKCKKYFYNFGKYFFRKTKCFWVFCPKKWLTSEVKKQIWKKYKKKYFRKKFEKKKYFGIFDPKKYFWRSLIIAPPLVKTRNFSSKGGGNYQATSGMSFFMSQ